MPCSEAALRVVTRKYNFLKYNLTFFISQFRTPNLCVLLHGALKTSSLCALVQVATNGSRNWFGIIFSHADSKKKFCLMLALFEPGNEPVPWLGNLLRLGPLDDLNASSQDPFPVKLLGNV